MFGFSFLAPYARTTRYEEAFEPEGKKRPHYHYNNKTTKSQERSPKAQAAYQDSLGRVGPLVRCTNSLAGGTLYVNISSENRKILVNGDKEARPHYLQ